MTCCVSTQIVSVDAAGSGGGEAAPCCLFAEPGCSGCLPGGYWSHGVAAGPHQVTSACGPAHRVSPCIPRVHRISPLLHSCPAQLHVYQFQEGFLPGRVFVSADAS